MRVTVGVHVDTEPQRLRATLASLAARTAVPHDVLLLGDGPDAATRKELAASALPSIVRDAARGGAAAFNDLARAGDANVIVFLAAGVIVSSGWLERLLAGLGADPRRGLAGPSTNVAWNEQGAFPRAGAHEVEAIAAEAAARFGSEAVSLAPLYSLGDFCLAVRRETLDAVGAAEEAYGLGPCWEMDYSIRAARAGWEAVWVRGAYVHRPPPTARRIAEETRRFDASRRLYQDRFCGARLRGEKHDYRVHCRGDACPNFAPADRIVIHRPLAAAKEIRIAAVAEAPPLVSCIMATRNRRDLVPEAVAAFLRQDYERRELLVIDDGDERVDDLLPEDARIRYIRADRRLTIGAKRNLGCADARGELIAHWDDDDWYPPWRLARQIDALRARNADVCGTSRLYFHDVVRGEAWEYRYPPASGWLAGTTLLYRKAFWERNRFPDTSWGEDSAFLVARVPKVLHDLAEPRLCVATLHGRNTSTKPEGPLWHRCAVDEIRAVKEDDRSPLVSCVTPTFDRRRFLPLALECFALQTYQNRELIVIDDGNDDVGDLLAGIPGVRHIRATRRLTVGAKRNRGCAEARGDVVVLWDDDDWYRADRIERQVRPIADGHADVTGIEPRIFLQLPQRRAWTIAKDLHRTMFFGDVAGGTLAFRRSLWSGGIRFPELNVGEDAWFLQQAVRRGARVARLENDGLFVYIRHGANTWRFDTGTFIDPKAWHELPPELGALRIDAYAAAARS